VVLYFVLDGLVAIIGEKINVYKDFVGKHEGKKQFGTLRCTWEDDNRVDLTEADEDMWTGFMCIGIMTSSELFGTP
jgi:hypothetical protein